MQLSRRWQIVLLAVAVLIFGGSLLLRFILGQNQEPEPTIPAPTATSETAIDITTPEAILEATATLIQAPINSEDISTEPTANTQSVSGNTGDSATYREAMVGTLGRLNPVFASINPVDQDISALIFEGLTKLNEYGEPVPALADRWVVSGDGLEYVFFLRDDIRWQDGLPFSADDLIYTTSVLSDPDFPGQPELHEFWETVEVTKIDNHTVRFRLAQPLGSFLYHTTIGILPEHVLSGTSAEKLASHPFNLSPIGTGPFQLEAIRTTNNVDYDIVDLVPAPTYWKRPEITDNPDIDRLRFRLYPDFNQITAALQSGEVDGYATNDRNERVALLSIPNVTVHTAVDPTIGVLIFNWNEEENQEFFSERRVRLALQAGLESSGIIERNLLNVAVPADSPLPLGSWAYMPNTVSVYDPEGASEALLEAARLSAEEGEVVGPDDIVGTFSILVPDTPILVNIAREIQEQWAQVNLEVTVDAVPEETYESRLLSGEFESAIVELSVGANPDVYSFWHQGQYPDGMNYGAASDNQISEDLEFARRESNGVVRKDLYAEFQQDFRERGVALPLYYPLFTYAVANGLDGVQLGFVGTPSERFRTIQDWQFN